MDRLYERIESIRDSAKSIDMDDSAGFGNSGNAASPDANQILAQPPLQATGDGSEGNFPSSAYGSDISDLAQMFTWAKDKLPSLPSNKTAKPPLRPPQTIRKWILHEVKMRRLHRRMP